MLHHLFFPPHFFTRTYQLNSRTALTLLDTHLPHPSGPFQPPRVPLSHPFAPLLPPPPPSLASFPRSGTSIRERKKRGLYLLTALCLYYPIDVHDELNIMYILYLYMSLFVTQVTSKSIWLQTLLFTFKVFYNQGLLLLLSLFKPL